MQQPQRVVPDVQIPVKEALVQAHAHGDRPHHLHVHALARLEEAHHVLPEPGHGLGALGRPPVRMPGLVLAPDLEALLQVRRRRALLAHGRRVELLRHLLAAGRRVAAVGLGRRPRDGELVGLGPREEARREGEGAAERLGRDGVVLEVDEARVLEAGEDRGRGLLALFGGAVEELGEVDELGGKSTVSWETPGGASIGRGGLAYRDEEPFLADGGGSGSHGSAGLKLRIGGNCGSVRLVSALDLVSRSSTLDEAGATGRREAA